MVALFKPLRFSRTGVQSERLSRRSLSGNHLPRVPIKTDGFRFFSHSFEDGKQTQIVLLHDKDTFWRDRMSSVQTTNWPDLAIGLYDRLTGRGAEIVYEFQELKVQVPSGTGSEAEHAQWVLNGKIKISTSDKGSSPN